LPRQSKEHRKVTDCQYEIVLYRLKPDTNRDRFLAISAQATAWLQQQPGYLGRELLADDGQWVDLVQWASMDDALAAANAFMDVPEAAAFMALVDPDSVRMLHPGRIVTYD
jgi:quinol monooxygenase YgiN